MLMRSAGRGIKRVAIIFIVAATTLLAIRIYDTQRGPALAPWHTFVPDELSADELDRADWPTYLRAEETIFRQVEQHVTQELDDDEQRPINRYFSGSPVYPGKFQHDWNRSYEMMPAGTPKGAAVLLHGLTDSPYSLRHIAERYRQRGFVVVGIRLPAHGTVPGALTDIHWQDWLAATRLAVREAQHRLAADSGKALPLHIVGFSNGGALALKYTLDALDDPRLTRPDQLILISPMIGITSYARFAGLAGLPAIFPAFAKSAWLGILPEFNPFKYNSFPVNGARQSWLLTHELQGQLTRKAQQHTLQQLPPVLTFQSVMDFTVSTQAVISSFYNLLPANGSQLVLFDVNRTINFGPLLRDSADRAASQLLPPAPRRYDTTVITNAAPDSAHAVAFDVQAGEAQGGSRALGIDYPRDVYSLSHVALPFPDTDSLYGRFSQNPREFGLPLGTIAARGERSVLVVDLDTLLRLSSNPFFPYLMQRIDGKIPQ
ncbi:MULTISPECIES: alpha/beta hydrolase [unclassified Brenneria]|uniref:alpha/beta hydrolase n=1 Tax=unclassified Brenneria TaxID=2634434 RepID=UPI0029C4C15C|nr:MULTISPECIES: alpha/beta hydrolase [unclassified Brenneria]MDX5628297.1 alpha/beta hydrolase [Brenneria sp. L3-3Z]MDX5695520.1 alpha/beta hydrolase [Brenneria sp. L4-2C]